MQIIQDSNHRTSPPVVSLWLDTRRRLKNSLYPLKLRVYFEGVQKIFRTEYSGNEADFNNYRNINSQGIRNKGNKDINRAWEALEKRAAEVADNLVPFSWELFEQIMTQRPEEVGTIYNEYQKRIDKFKEENKIGTAEAYENSRKSLTAFCETFNKLKSFNTYKFKDVDASFLKKYENWMLKDRSRTTVSIYIRALRSVYNSAGISGNDYPFHHKGETGKYLIPKSRNMKKALSAAQLKILFQHPPGNIYQEKARDIWFFTYSASGMNIRDFISLKWKNLSSNKIEYIRTKTKDTSHEIVPITVILNDFMERFIKKYSVVRGDQESYIFEYIKNGISETEIRKSAKNLTRFVNQHIKLLAKSAGLTEEISTIWSRHTFATQSVKAGASIRLIQESLGHSSILTTQNYLDTFKDEELAANSSKLMNFINE